MNKLYGLFLDDTKPLEVPSELQGMDIEWTHFKSAREFLCSDYLEKTSPSYVVFDYYMERGFTGEDMILEIISHAKSHNIPFPKAYFNSSDQCCNHKMFALWSALTQTNIEQSAVKSNEVKKKVSGVAAHFRRNKK